MLRFCFDEVYICLRLFGSEQILALCVYSKPRAVVGCLLEVAESKLTSREAEQTELCIDCVCAWYVCVYVCINECVVCVYGVFVYVYTFMYLCMYGMCV